MDFIFYSCFRFTATLSREILYTPYLYMLTQDSPYSDVNEVETSLNEMNWHWYIITTQSP